MSLDRRADYLLPVLTPVCESLENRAKGQTRMTEFIEV